MSLNIYTPLNEATSEIRLLTLLSDTELRENDPLYDNSQTRCELRTESLDTNPKYEALSYVWGPPSDDDYSITINGVRVQVRYNLLLALNALRTYAGTEKDRRTFWIDALCINQNDLSERGQQVQFMGRIYASSNKVVAWLGPQEDGLSLDFEVGRSLLKSEYWSRLWIIQEICLAPSIQLLHGTGSYGWWEFLKLIQNIPNPDKATSENLGRVQRFHGALRLYPSYDPRERNLLGMLNISRDRLCQDPRDKLYGILSLAYDLKDSEVSVSYTISLFELFCSVIKCIEFERGREGRNLLGRFGNLQDPNLFSWDVIEFCQSLQLSLLSPSFGEVVHQEMQTSRCNDSQEAATESMKTWAETKLWLGGRRNGKILRVAQRYEGLLDHLVSEKPVRPDCKKSANWHAAMKTIWELDHRSFVKFTYNHSETATTLNGKSQSSGSDKKNTKIESPLTRLADKTTESGDGLILFLTSEMEIGLAPNGTMRGDDLWTYETHSYNPASWAHAIVRQHKGDEFRVYGRALLADTIPGLVDNADIYDKPAASKNPKELKENDTDMVVYANLAQLQVLSCPLRSEHVIAKS